MNNITREPPQVRPGQYGYINRVYKSSLRPVVLFISSLAGLWALISGVNAFRLLGQADSGNIPHLRTIALILGILYMIAVVIETFGVAAALTVHASCCFVVLFLFLLFCSIALRWLDYTISSQS